MRTICVFAGSHTGDSPHFAEAAEALGAEIARRGLELVYGGGGVGLMGLLAESALDHGGRVIGVMPRGLFSAEAAHRDLTEFYEVGSMHERKKLMSDLADGFIALPGGFGTFDELVEIITWAQIGIHSKPIVLLNIDNYFAPFLALITHVVANGFIEPEYMRLFSVADDVVSALNQLGAPQPPAPSLMAETAAGANGANGLNGANATGATGATKAPKPGRARHAPIANKHPTDEAPPAP